MLDKQTEPIMEDYVSPYVKRKIDMNGYKAVPAGPQLSRVNSLSGSPNKSYDQLIEVPGAVTVADTSNPGVGGATLAAVPGTNAEDAGEEVVMSNNKSRSPSFFDSLVPSFLSRKSVITASDVDHLGTLGNGLHSKELYRDSKYHYASEKRNESFHNIFPGIPKNDPLIDDFGCVLHKNHAYNGRIYISEQHISFNSSFVDWMTKIIIPFKDIKHIEKTSSSSIGGALTHAITIEVENKDIYILTGFISTDVTFDLLNKVWSYNIHGNLPVDYVPGHKRPGILDFESNELVWTNKSNLSSRRPSVASSPIPSFIDRPLFIENSGTFARSYQMLLAKNDNLKKTVTENSNNDAIMKAILSIDEPEPVIVKQANDSNNDNDDDSSDEMEHSPASDSTGDITTTTEIRTHKLKDTAKMKYNGPLHNVETQFEHDAVANKETILKNITINAPPGIIFEIIFSSTDHSFMLDFLKSLDSSNFTDIGAFDGIENERGYTYIKALNYSVGPKSTKCVVTEKVMKKDFYDTINVVVETKTPNVPSGNSFSTNTRYQFRWASPTTCDLQISYWVEWTGSSWIKGMIESSCKSGQEEASKALEKLLNKYVDENIEETKVSSKPSSDLPRKEVVSEKHFTKETVIEKVNPAIQVEAAPKPTPATVKWFTWILVSLLGLIILLLIVNIILSISLQSRLDKLLILQLSRENIERGSGLFEIPVLRDQHLRVSPTMQDEIVSILRKFIGESDTHNEFDNTEIITKLYSALKNWN